MAEPLCANAPGFSLHAGVPCDADQSQALEHLRRHITRLAIASERLIKGGAIGSILALGDLPFHI
jgi:hypothetical protein